MFSVPWKQILPHATFHPQSTDQLTQKNWIPILKKVKSVLTVLELEVNYLTLKMFYVYHKLSLKSNHSSLRKLNQIIGF